MSGLAVLGSLNADLVTRVEAFPRPGQTLQARAFQIHAGGKGANQAVACGQLGAPVAMYGALGRDGLAPRLLDSLQGANVRADDLLYCDDAPTGTASIWVDDAGENMIGIHAGANGRVDADYVDQILPVVARADWLLLQLEIPLAAMKHLLERLPASRPRVMLDPAPAADLGPLPTERLSLLTPNEHELAALTGEAVDTDAALERACRALRASSGAGAVVCKAGARGAYLLDEGGFRHVPGHRVDAVDTTAAGDAFNGGLAVALLEGQLLDGAVGFAHAVAALSVTRAGAQPSMPTRQAVEAFLPAVGNATKGA